MLPVKRLFALNKLQPLFNRNHTPISTAEFQKGFSLADERVRLIPKTIGSRNRLDRPFGRSRWGRCNFCNWGLADLEAGDMRKSRPF